MNSTRRRLWDLPTRLFHWLLVLAVVGAVITGQLGGNLIVWHGRLGLLIAGLLAFRLVWGFIGSTYARFGQFIPTPAKIRAYLAGKWQGMGHNPLGALSVFALLGLLTAQVSTGLLANDDIAFVGPLYDLIDKELSNQLTSLHHKIGDLLIILIGLHVAAIMFYAHVKKQNLVKPMVTGWHEGEMAGETPGEPARGGGWLAFVLALLIALGGVYAASGEWLPEPPPLPPASEAPSW